jgi:ferrous iron transport protein B
MEASQWLKEHISPGVFTDLLAEGIVPGIGGVVVFIPQIALLFFFLSILEESGYMSRVVFMMDKLVRPFGLNGKSVVPLVGSVACAIPGIMATRTISSWKDRMVTIMVAPLMSCSARIPVFTLLIALTIPDEKFGPFNLKGLVLLGLYLLGLFGALFMAVIFKYLIRPGEKGYLLMEMPTYQWPRWKAILILVKEKVQVFVFDAGKVILAISILLWVLCSYGPSQRMDLALSMVELPNAQNGKTEKIYEAEMEAVRLENSYIGIVGKAIEPSIKPLGYDWKIGISLLTSFAAREVFVGSMAAIYSVGEDFEEDSSLLDRMRNEKHVDTGLPVYTLASGVSLMVFYVFAMQCMSTLAVVKRETRSWKWPLIQLFYMGILAYVAAWISFVILS